jgi:hypothetical protein
MIKEVYRYEAVSYAVTDHTDHVIASLPKLELRTYNVWKETPKGYWVGYGSPSGGSLRGSARWVSKTAKKRYAYPTTEEALQSFIKRYERRVEILRKQLDDSTASLKLASLKLAKLKL